MNQKIKSNLTSISQQAHSALKATDELIGLLDRDSSQQLDKKEIQQRYRLFADITSSLTESITDEMLHIVAAPKETGHDEAGNPTLLIPEMLSTKKSVEQENCEKELAKEVQNYFENRKDLEQINKRDEFFQEIGKTVEERNEALDRLIEKTLDAEQTVSNIFKAAFEKLEKIKPKALPNKRAIAILKKIIG